MNRQRRTKEDIKDTSSIANIMPDDAAADGQRRVTVRQILWRRGDGGDREVVSCPKQAIKSTRIKHNKDRPEMAIAINTSRPSPLKWLHILLLARRNEISHRTQKIGLNGIQIGKTLSRQTA